MVTPVGRALPAKLTNTDHEPCFFSVVIVVALIASQITVANYSQYPY